MNRRGFLAAAGALGLAPRAAAAQPQALVLFGDDVLLREQWREIGNRCVGIVTNQTGITSSRESIVDALRHNSHVCLKALFAPEHGLRGDRSAGAYVPSYTDPSSGLPVYSLYGATRRPTRAMLADIDLLLFDIQDVGARAYTFISTMAYVMQAAAEHDKEIWILDRPNPIGGTIVEGPVLEPEYKSFIGLYPIAMRHGMTIGELAQMYNDAFGIHAKLRIVPMRGWSRSMLWDATGHPWIQSSPNIPTWQTAVLYPCTGLIASAGINNATGTPRPFQYAGAYGLDAQRYADAMNALSLPGVSFQGVVWVPASGFWAGKTLSGVALGVYDPHAFLAVRTAVELLVTARKIAPHVISIQSRTTIDRDWGTDTLREGLLSGKSADEIIAGWQPRLADFNAQRAKYLLYQ
ncbi:MAG TPA: DUF1343 domain-containing protein [Candidatus Acidoferrales bacterium]|nr:DUF1343 domain-containing protein [Candidatus Acidoferrales bacterium]